MQNLESLKTKADQLATELATNDAANAAEHAAAVELLNKVIAIAKPAVRAIGESYRNGDDLDSEFNLGGRSIKLFGRRMFTSTTWFQDGDVHLTVDGLMAVSTEPETLLPVDMSEWKAAGILEWVEIICSAIASAGSRIDATKAALARAEKLKALAALL